MSRICDKDREYFEAGGDLDDPDEAGVSRSMAKEFDLEKRISLLLIHSMVHLLGYDHEEDDEWKEMTTKEDEIIEKVAASKVPVIK